MRRIVDRDWYPDATLSLTAGARLGPYEIVSPLGAGGMGEVYRARDTRLERDVAVKVLPAHLSSSEEMRQRFEREAKAISQLSHPHICALYDVGSHEGTEYLVMEYLEGETLAERLVKGPLPLEQTLRFGVEIADALDKAHRQGIVHRDLKPGNVMLTKSGVKLLDFGLAKAIAPMGVQSGLTALPTVAGTAQNLTQEGTILGTFQYMAPEQLEGKEADARSDIFAFGAVLYEMATGRKAFSGKSQASLISSIMKEEPAPIAAVSPLTPPALERVVRTCLAKDPEDRWQSAHDIGSELEWITEGSQAGVAAPVVPRRRSRERLAWSVAAAALLALAAVALFGRRAAERPKAIRLSLESPAKAPFEFFDHAAPSPDGWRVAFIAHAAGGKRSLWVRPLDSLGASPLPGSDGASEFFWSPNSASIGFFAEGKLKRIEASGGPPQVLAEAPTPNGGTWNRDGVIVFAPKLFDGLYRVAATGGTPAPVTKLGPHEDSHIWPCFLPDGRHFVFLGDASATENHSIRLGSLDSPESERLVTAVSNVGFAPPDLVLFVRAGALVAQRLDLPSRKLVGDPVSLGEQIAQVDLLHRFEFAASASGVLLYRSANPDSQLFWLDRSGRRLSTVGQPVRYGVIELSPDEKQLAFERLDADARHANLWLLDLARGSTSRLTATAGSDYSPVWSPDGKRILFASARSGFADLYEIAAGGGSAERLVYNGPGGDKVVNGWSPDGRFVLLQIESAATLADIWMLPLSADSKPVALVQSRFADADAQISADSRWFAYSSDESGRAEVYVQSFADASKRIQVSTAGGSRPRWRGDGKELFFLAGSVLQAVEIKAGASLEAGKPRDLFKLPVWQDYAVTRDGQRILAATSIDENPFLPMTVVLNWTAGLKKPI
jgi:WD40 repeat protein/predicted Ser/Thr protein kinase